LSTQNSDPVTEISFIEIKGIRADLKFILPIAKSLWQGDKNYGRILMADTGI